LYYLKDLSLIGCGFISKRIVKKKFGRTLIQGDFIINGKIYPAEVVHFSNGRPSLLRDILGVSAKETDSNLQAVVSYVEHCILHNTNGIASVIKQRLALSIIRTFTTAAIFFIFGKTIYKYIAFGYYYDKLPILAVMFLMCIVLLFLNRKTRSY